MLLAAIYDAIQSLTHVQVAVGGGKSEAPTPMPRPGVVTKRGKSMNPQALAYLQRIREMNENREDEGAGQ